MKNVSLPKAVLTVGGLAMVVYHAVASQYLYFSQWEHQTIHFAFLFLMVFMSYAIKAKSRLAAVGLYLCLAAALACCVYVYGNIEELEMSQGFPTRAALLAGLCLILATALGTWLCWGLPLLLVAVVFVAYFFFGHLLSGPLYHPAFGFDYVVSMLSVGLSGLYGLFMSISADQVFMFVVFGALLGIFKVEGLLMELGKILGRRLRGGAGLTGVFSNSLIGMVAQTLISTGLGSKLASLIHILAGGQLFIALLVTMVVALILGCAVPPAAAYALCAIIIIPTLTPMGVDLLRAHMFCFYFSIIAAVTPPVGLASLAATGISGGNYALTSVHGFRLSLSGFILPFLIIYNPLFSFDFSNAAWAACSLVCILTGLTSLDALLYGAMARPFTARDYTLSAVVMLASFWLTIWGAQLAPPVCVLVTLGVVALLAAQWFRQVRGRPSVALRTA